MWLKNSAGTSIDKSRFRAGASPGNLSKPESSEGKKRRSEEVEIGRTQCLGWLPILKWRSTFGCTCWSSSSLVPPLSGSPAPFLAYPHSALLTSTSSSSTATSRLPVGWYPISVRLSDIYLNCWIQLLMCAVNSEHLNQLLDVILCVELSYRDGLIPFLLCPLDYWQLLFYLLLSLR